MLQPRLRASLVALEHLTSSKSLFLKPFSPHNPLTAQSLPPFLTFFRSAHHASEGRANGPKDRPGRRLGAKKTGEQYVIPGNIIFRQRGTKWFPGENCAMGRDHTIYATEKGYVKYYKDPRKHPKRQYIGVAFERDDTLPSPTNAPRKRRLGMVAVPIAQVDEGMAVGLDGVSNQNFTPLIDSRAKTAPLTKKKLTMKRGYMFRETNYEIGRAAERADVRIQPYVRGNRWLAWRKKAERVKQSAELRAQKALKKARKSQKRKEVQKNLAG